ncbi:sugar-binding domain-containing protein [Pontiella agarivorans]|uniref:Glycoside hydrolase family 2 TIM barrel-domain containing protein n=1 Tax=Pontiella agarivorans TaxID=3038953 RepID=A0ABU5MS74_9BACT|nr:sugar-binding domain-containing protein [Pontiella agarivorans]MDZ8117051.1 glycoside hydrolase family 2 TIM barrel-domain containing protein [Pontiella agarivorans]
MNMKWLRVAGLLLIVMSGSAAAQPDVLSRYSGETVSLNGKWELTLAPDEALGNQPAYTVLDFNDSVKLPGTLTENKKGIRNTNRDEQNHLSREFMFEGTAWYKRLIHIPRDWKNRRIVLRLERTRKTAVWLDGTLLGIDPSLSTAHVIDLGDVSPGKHELVVAVDNVMDGSPNGRSHMNVEDTQTNWNGMLGKLQLEATPKVWIERVRVFPDIGTRQATMELLLKNKRNGKQRGEIHIATESFNSAQKDVPPSVTVPFEFNTETTTVKAVVKMGEGMLLWDEFDPALYRAIITLKLVDGQQQKLGRTFGMRDFTQNGSQFVINGKTTFLRGKHDACVFPLTGYAPMEVEEWVRVLKIAKSYGINHYRFHTWCPPEAALAAADLVGIYMQPELPCWGVLWEQERNLKITDVNAVAFGSEKTGKGRRFSPDMVTEAEAFFHEEGRRILDQYGDHASFVMLGIGNELKGNVTVMQRLVDGYRKADDDRRLYTQGSNNNFRDPKKGATDDYWTTVRTSTKTWKEYDNITRTSYSAADQFDFGPINHFRPSTRVNFSKALENTDVPVIGHETGQYSYYPDYNELEKYTGVTKPWNLELGQKLLKEKGMYDQWPEFFKAAGIWASILYCEDMESGIRTPGFGGFQLLDLQDFPGQGTALVGPLNAFMESKGTITPEKWREFSAPVTLLAGFDMFTLTAGETFTADLKVANYGPADVNGILKWRVPNFGKGSFEVQAAQGGITSAGQIDLKLPFVEKAVRTSVELELNGMVKSYPLWIYPRPGKLNIPADVTVSRKLDEATFRTLENGGRVLLIPEHEAIKENSVGGLFMTEFWSFTMFRKIALNRGVEPSAGTLGLLIDEDHPALTGFPTEFHSNWQWWAPVKNSRPIILDDAPKGYRPLVQSIDNMWRSHKLGTLFEFKVGQGRVLVSAIDLPAIQDTAEGHALYQSLLDYTGSDAFKPETAITADALGKLLGK